MMSSESDSEVFFDAEDTTPVRTSKTKGKHLKVDEEEKLIDVLICENVDAALPVSICTQDKIGFPAIQVNSDDMKEVERKAKENEKRRRKVEELRKRMLTDEDEILEVPSEQSSLTSSGVDGIFPSVSLFSLTPHTFNPGSNMLQKPDELKSVISLGKVGSILGEKDSKSDVVCVKESPDTISLDSKYSMSENEMFCELSTGFTKSIVKGSEPDLVASTKGTDIVLRPVVPPRRKRKNKSCPKAQTPTDVSESSDFADSSSPSYTFDSFSKKDLGSSSDLESSKIKGKNGSKSEVSESSCGVEMTKSSYTIENLPKKDFECSLDLHSATRGQYVVKPQDREQNRAEGAGAPSGNYQFYCETDSISAGEFNLQLSAVSKKGSAKRDEDISYVVRTRTDSGRPLTDQEILEQVKVLNLDTGEQIPLSLAEEHLPKCLNPLSLHIMRLTSEYVSNTALDKQRESDEESIDSKKAESLDASKVWSIMKESTKQIGKNIGNRVEKLRVVVADKVHHTRHNEEDLSDDELPGGDPQRSNVEIKISSKLKSVGRSEFETIKVVEELSGEHTGAIWTMKFSCCGRLLATAGQDHDLRIWVLNGSFKFFDDMRKKFNAEGKTSPTPQSQESSPTGTLEAVKNSQLEKSTSGPFMEEPFCRYKGHTAELLDVSWSKNYFILSSSMDKTVRLWHISRQECLCCFQHIDFVTAIAFHPRDDRYFLSGSLDGKLRLWNIPDKKVTLWNELDGNTKLITAVNFCRNGKIAVVGSYDGRCIFYNTDQLKYYTQIHVRSSRGKNKVGRKISGIEAMPGEDKILVTSNDSRIRLYDLRDLSLSCKYKGYVNLSSQIKATFSHDGRYIISGSENQYIYMWKSFHDYAKFSRRDRNDYWERIKAHNAVVTSAVFAPNPSLILKELEEEKDSAQAVDDLGIYTNYYVMVTADFSGTIKVFLHKSKPGVANSS